MTDYLVGEIKSKTIGGRTYTVSSNLIKRLKDHWGDFAAFALCIASVFLSIGSLAYTAAISDFVAIIVSTSCFAAAMVFFHMFFNSTISRHIGNYVFFVDVYAYDNEVRVGTVYRYLEVSASGDCIDSESLKEAIAKIKTVIIPEYEAKLEKERACQSKMQRVFEEEN